MAALPDPTELTATQAVAELADTTGAKKRTWLGAIWDTADLPANERRLLFKTDAVILTFASLGYFCKNLDQGALIQILYSTSANIPYPMLSIGNLTNAFLSGMKEDLNMRGNELVYASSLWTAGYVVGQIPVNLALSRVSPRWVIPFLELGWGIVTLATYSVKSYKALYACRFLVGLFEAGFFPSIVLILGSWYTPRELAKRIGIFWASGILGTMFSGFLQAAAYTNLTGVDGLAGWRWLFIIDAIITLPIGIAGFFFLPDEPFSAKPNIWLTQADITLAQARLVKVGRRGRTHWTIAKVKKIFATWHVWVMPIVYLFWLNGQTQNPMGYWLKSFNTKPYPVPGRHYTVPQINLLPLPATAMFAVGLTSYSWVSDGLLRGRRWPTIYFGSFLLIILDVTLRYLPLYSSNSGHFVLYYLLGFALGGGPSIFAWTNEHCSDDFEKRAFVTAWTNNLSYVMNAIAPNFVWRTTDFPAAHRGFTYSAILQGGVIITVTVAYFLERRDRRRAALPSPSQTHPDSPPPEKESSLYSRA